LQDKGDSTNFVKKLSTNSYEIFLRRGISHQQETVWFECWSGSQSGSRNFWRNFYGYGIGPIERILWHQLPWLRSASPRAFRTTTVELRITSGGGLVERHSFRLQMNVWVCR